MRIAMSVCVYYSFDHLFPQHGWGCWEKWELQCLCVYIITLITYFPSTEGVAERNESCNVCVCILLPWSPISPTWRGGGGTHGNENSDVCICILFLWSSIFPSWRGMLREMSIAMYVCVYYTLDHIFPKHGGGCWEKWELQCLCVYIIPLITYFPNMEGVAERNESCHVCVCILFPWSHISQTWWGLLIEMIIAMSVCESYSLD